MLRLAAELLGGIASPLQWTEENFVHNASQKDQRKTCNRLPPHCQHTLLQGVCLHDPCMGGGGIGKISSKNLTRFLFRPKRFDNKSDFGRTRSSYVAVVDHQLRFIEHLGYTKSGNVVKRFAYTKYFRPIDLHVAMPVAQSNR